VYVISVLRRSIIWTTPSDEFKKIVSDSRTITECLNKLGLTNKGRNNKTFLARVEEENISIEHIRKQSASVAQESKRIPLEDFLVLGREVKGSAIKRKLIAAGLMKDECAVCGQLPEWNGKPLSLELDHINGNRLDNRIENLRIICPHCHSQTDTFRGRANKGKKHYQEKTKYYCQDCNAEITCGAERCTRCSKLSQRKVVRPDREILLADIAELGYSGTGRKYGVSDNAVRKWL
jgi:5-methylcytosine-specific restriction endonuclease McrA